jgi:23S rRNA (adenine2030-N6)-methyltransferase
MNYRHIYHAGNFADVVKHVVLLTLLEHLGRKPQAFCYLDTHAGIGRYPLGSTEAQKTLEYRSGVMRLYRANGLPPALARYVQLVRASDPANDEQRLAVYPGSPLLARALLRPQDRAVLMELHPDDAATLKEVFRGDDQIAVHQTDGYHGLKAFLPPKERRGMALIDPPFEAPDEFDRLVEGLQNAHRRWATGLYAIWYPVKDRRDVWRFETALKKSGIPKILLAELCLYPNDLPDRLNGCGMVIVNPPWQHDALLQGLLPTLAEHLAPATGSRLRVEWLARE